MSMIDLFTINGEALVYKLTEDWNGQRHYHHQGDNASILLRVGAYWDCGLINLDLLNDIKAMIMNGIDTNMIEGILDSINTFGIDLEYHMGCFVTRCRELGGYIREFHISGYGPASYFPYRIGS